LTIDINQIRKEIPVLLKYVKVNNSYRFARCQLNYPDHSFMLKAKEIATSAGYVKIFSDGRVRVGGKSFSLNLSPKFSDQQQISELIFNE